MLKPISAPVYEILETFNVRGEYGDDRQITARKQILGEKPFLWIWSKTIYGKTEYIDTANVFFKRENSKTYTHIMNGKEYTRV